MTRTLHLRTTISIAAFLLTCQTLFSQYGYDWRTEVDRIIEQTDSLSLKSQQTFYTRNIIRIDRSFKNDIEVRETWHYTVHKGKVIVFEIRYLVDSTEYIENYYLDNNRLICMESYESEFFNPTDANFIAGEVLFYVNDQVKLHISTGSKKDPITSWRLESRPLEKFLARYAELKRNLKDVAALER